MHPQKRWLPRGYSGDQRKDRLLVTWKFSIVYRKLGGGCARIRTLDPLIKRKRLVLCKPLQSWSNQNEFQ